MTTKNSHYVARHLTKPWEFGQRQLWVYDFEEDRFSVVSSKKLLTTETPWNGAIEAFLNKYLETPLSGFLDRFNKTRDSSDITQTELRALKLALVLQVPRTGGDTIDLAQIVDRGEDYLNSLTVTLDRMFQFTHIPLKQASMCFPELGYTMVPLHGAPPAMGIILHPSYLTIAMPRPADQLMAQIETYMKSTVDVFGSLSVGLDPCRRVIIPGYAYGDASEGSMRFALQQARFRAKSLVQTMLDANVEDFGEAFPKPPMVKDWPTIVRNEE